MRAHPTTPTGFRRPPGPRWSTGALERCQRRQAGRVAASQAFSVDYSKTSSTQGLAVTTSWTVIVDNPKRSACQCPR